MAYNKHKGVLVFMILYTVLFVFDGIRVFDAPLPSSLTTYLVYTIMFLYGCFLFKSELLKKWEEVRSSKRKFFLGVLKGWLLLVLVTIFFGLLIAVFACIIGPLVEELFFRQILLHCLQRHLPSWLSICVVGFVFALTHMHSLSLSEWVSAVGYLGGGVALSIIYVNEKGNIYYPLMVHVLGNILSFIVLVIGSVQ